MRTRRHYRGGYEFGGLVQLARTLRNQQTRAEELLWSILRDRQLLGFKFRRQHQFRDYVADSYCHQAQLVIECDGPIHESNERWHHDPIREAYLISQGLRVLRFTNEEIFENVESVLEHIVMFLPSDGERIDASVGDAG